MIYTPIRNSADTVRTLNEKYGGKCLILSGIEISEGFWFNSEYEKIHNLLPYDVIIGSVHCVKCEGLEMPYSLIDFNKLSEIEIRNYLSAYFDDLLNILYEFDFDILAHLTCPLRYIVYKFGADVDISVYDDIIDTILSKVIEKSISLEVNTSNSQVSKPSFMPDEKIIKRYFDLGGRKITLGSDAHSKERVGICFNEAISFLKNTGFTNAYYYENRKPVEYKL